MNAAKPGKEVDLINYLILGEDLYLLSATYFIERNLWLYQIISQFNSTFFKGNLSA